MGATHFLMKTLPRGATEMALHVLAYNLTRVVNIIGPGGLIAAIRTRSPKEEIASTDHDDARNGSTERQRRSETTKQPKSAQRTGRAATEEAANSQASAPAFSHNQNPLKIFVLVCASTGKSARPISCDVVGSCGHTA
jgi:hypothetical protein